MYIVLLNDDLTPRREIETLGEITVKNKAEITWEGGSLFGIKTNYIVTGELKDQYTEAEIINSYKAIKIKCLLRCRDREIESAYADLSELDPAAKENAIRHQFNQKRIQIVQATTLEEFDAIEW